jgi:hypothetical protein
MEVSMLVEGSILGTIIGYIGRLIPEIIKIIYKYLDNKKEENIAKAQITNNIQVDVKMPEQPQEVVRCKKIEIINSLVRPSTTYIILGLYVIIKIWWYILNPTATLECLWNKEDVTLLSSIISFWFLGRVLDKKS